MSNWKQQSVDLEDLPDFDENEDYAPIGFNPPSIFDKYRQDSLDSWLDLLCPDLNFAQNFEQILGNFVFLPNAKLQLPILTSAIIAPTPMCDILPITFCYGGAGSGKSTVGILASLLHDVEPLGATSTFASIRNECARLRVDRYGNQRIYMLIWDDIKSSTFTDSPQIYALFRSGYDRKTDLITIASENGENMRFRVFGGRLTSSIEPVFNNPKFSELQRRTLPIICKKLSNFTPSELNEINLPDDSVLGDKASIGDYNWDGMNKALTAFWEDEERLTRFSEIKREIKLSKVIKSEMGERVTILRDLICTAVSAELFPNLPDAVDHFMRYWSKIAEPQFRNLSVLSRLLIAFIEEELAIVIAYNQANGYERIPIAIAPKKIKAHIQQCASNGEIDIVATPKEIAACMRQIGWELHDCDYPGIGKGMYWIRAIA